MELTSSQKKKIRSYAQKVKANVQIGKNDITPELIETIKSGLTAHELIKVHLLNNADLTKEEAILELTESLPVDYAYVIGRQIVLFKQSPKKEKRNLSLKL